MRRRWFAPLVLPLFIAGCATVDRPAIGDAKKVVPARASAGLGGGHVYLGDHANGLNRPSYVSRGQARDVGTKHLNTAGSGAAAKP